MPLFTFTSQNLKFDGEFIIYWLIQNGYEFIEDKSQRKDKTFTCLITDTGQFFSIEVYFEIKNKGKKVKKATFYDSLKIIPFGVDKIAKSFDLPIRKLEIDYNAYRERENYQLTEQEIDYIKNDVTIVAMALKKFFDEGLTKMTQASNSMYDYKKIITPKYFKEFYPELSIDLDGEIRSSYRGGFTYLNSKKYANKVVGEGIVLDVNSLYPSIMYEKPMPFGKPVFFEGRYIEDKTYDLYIQRLACSFKVKKNMIPTIQLKGNLSFMPNEYVEDTKGEIVSLTLTSVDLKLFLEHYEATSPIIWGGGWKFRSITGLFTEYIDKWTARKIQAKKEGNGVQYQLSKLMLNSLYRKFALNPHGKTKKPNLSEEVVEYSDMKEKLRKPIYIPVGSFITSYAREKTIRTSQAIKDYSIKHYGKDLYIYSDTDSIHTLLPIEECKKFCDIDDYRLGAWKFESKFSKAKFIRQKTYVEIIDGEMKITCAGMPPSIYSKVTFDNFKVGFTSKGGKLTYKHIKGGVKLVETDFTIKGNIFKNNIEKFI